MQFLANPMMVRLTLSFCVFAAASVLADSVTPTQKVIQLLADMEAKAKKMKNEEEVAFSEFSQFCDDRKASTAKDIQDAAELMETLAADISKLESDIKELSEKIDDLHNVVANDQADLKKAKDQREKDHASYSEEIQDFAESTDALERAVAVLKKQDYDRKQASSALIQLTTSKMLPDKVKRTVAAFLAMSTGEDPLDYASPEANAYEFQSGGILELLEKLRVEFQGKLTESQKEEMNSRHAYEMMSQDLHDSIENAEADIVAKTGIKQEKIQAKAEKTKRLHVTTTGHDEDVKYLSELKAECFEKSESFKEKQDLRTEEIKAIGKAIEILKSPEVSGAAQEHLPAASALVSVGTALPQLRSLQTPDARMAAAKYLSTAGRRLHSQRLAMVAQEMSSSSDPFVKVKKMIADMITRLLEETNQETEQKGFCDKELGTNAKTRTKLQTTIDELTAKIDENEALILSSSQRVAELSKEVTDLQTAMKDATLLRQEEKSKNAETVADAEEALKAIAAATAILKEFYEKSSSATALLQNDISKPTMGSEEWNSLANPNFDGKVDKGHKEGMQTFGKKYTGLQDEAGGVFAMLEVISSDFSTLKADTESSEAASVETYSRFMADSKKAVAVKEKESEMLTNDKATATAEKTADTKDLKATQDQLLAADRYYEKLKPTCVDNGISYADRVKARQEEIKSLQEALRILSSE